LSWIRRVSVAFAAVAFAAAAPAHAQPLGGDPDGAGVQARLDAEEAARKAAEERLAAAEKALAEQAAAVKQAADALAAQKQAIDALAAQLAAEKAAREGAMADLAKAAAQTPLVASRWAGVSVSGFAQIDYYNRQSSIDELDNSTGATLNQDRFLVRRARVRVSADYGRAFGSVELDTNTVAGPQVRPMDLEASYSLADRMPGGTSAAAVTAGIFKTPFGQEIAESDTDRLFFERSLSERALFPGEYDLGAKIAGTWRAFNYAVAVMNGEPIGEKAFPLRDPNGAKDLVGRVGIDTMVGVARLVAGASALDGTGFHAGTPSTKDQIVWRDLNEDGVVELPEIQNIPGQPATPSLSFSRFALGADARLVAPVHGLGNFEARGEIYVAKNLDRGLVIADPIASGRPLRETGYYAHVQQELPHGLQAGVRYDHYDPDADHTDLQSGNVVPATQTFTTWSFAAAYRDANYRFVLQYDVNRNHQGRGPNGVPTNFKDNALLLRAEIRF
jgi:hypothetical protein